MKKMTSLSELYECVASAGENEWIYTNIEAWHNNPQHCEFYFISEDEVEEMADDEVYESEAGPYLPASVKNLDLYPWMQIDVLKGVLENAGINNEHFDDNNFVKAINYYRENDDFMDA
ncbi:hypothetical protein ACIGHN_24125 [Acidovorax sp. NPDC077693]|uniref:DUF7716 domain-containing protein n=1 Tax=unclassified Acidovorax TaxID=2684926 RepID=UPI0037C60FAA